MFNTPGIDWTTYYKILSQDNFDFLIKIKLNYEFIFNILNSKILLQKIICLNDKQLDIINKILMYYENIRFLLDNDIEFLLDNIDFIESHDLYKYNYTISDIKNLQVRYYIQTHCIQLETKKKNRKKNKRISNYC